MFQKILRSLFAFSARLARSKSQADAEKALLGAQASGV